MDTSTKGEPMHDQIELERYILAKEIQSQKTLEDEADVKHT
jgi:hypothetical protein